MIKQNISIKGIVINNIEYKMTQFADDTTLFLDGSRSCLQAALNTIKTFGSYSGLNMNMSKTKTIWIGRKRYSRDKINTTPMLTWGETEFDLLGLKFSVNLPQMIQLNYNKYILQAKDIIHHWCSRKSQEPNILTLQSRIKSTYQEQQTISNLNGHIHVFDKTWNIWKPLFENIQ